MAGHSAPVEIVNPGPLKVASKWKILYGVLLVVGAAVFALVLQKDPERAWSNFLINHFYFFSLALGGVFFAAVQWVTGSMWSASIRRVAESFTSYLPVSLLTMAGIFAGMGVLYHWTHPDVVQGDIILEHKAGYLNTTFFVVRGVVVMLLFLFFRQLFVGRSLKQDDDKNYAWSVKNAGLAPIFLIVFGVGFSMLAFDQLMSLDPHWFSTMFGVYAFAGLFYSTLALLGILTVLFKRSGAFGNLVTTEHVHAVGKFMFAFSVFWAYIGFSQFMLIWYANLPEETGYMIRRMSEGWLYVTIFLYAGKFMIPFFALLPVSAKRNDMMVLGVGSFMLLCQWVDLAWMVQPQFYPDGLRLGWQEIGISAGFIGLFGLLVSRFLGRHNLVAVGDPRLPESVVHHQ
jgi:hypothetical protein